MSAPGAAPVQRLEDSKELAPPVSALARARRLLPAAAVIAADLWSKSFIFGWLADGTAPGLVRDSCGHLRYPVSGDWLAWMLSTNRGMAFSLLEQHPFWLVGGRVLAVVGLSLYLLISRAAVGLYGLALSLVLGGALGNLYDNLALPKPEGHPFGEVRDFIDVCWRSVGDFGPFHNGHFPTFNVADSSITVGAVLLFLSSLRSHGSAEAR